MDTVILTEWDVVGLFVDATHSHSSHSHSIAVISPHSRCPLPWSEHLNPCPWLAPGLPLVCPWLAPGLHLACPWLAPNPLAPKSRPLPLPQTPWS